MTITNAASTYLTISNGSTSYATQETPTFSGTVTFIDTDVTPNTSTTIKDYLKLTTAASTYLTITNASTTYLTISNASTSYATKVTPTFSGTVTFIDTDVIPNTSTTIKDYLKITTAASTYLTITNAASTYLTICNASTSYAPKMAVTTSPINNDAHSAGSPK